ncbi:MAG: alkaline phosphatase family protein [Myxococcales bacterium]|nr:alkaline phosphatase family protein [Myxococcales bacterium]USN51691.1 MAG: alkaline phosphatase family protein [Myxococcales bacterium]
MKCITVFFLALSYSLGLLARSPIILVSIDGLRPDAIYRTQAKTLKKLINTGNYFSRAITIRPSITLPSHTSMLTGVSPKKHGIDWNSYQPELGVVQYPTALEIAKNNGYKTAIFAAKEKFLHLKRENGVDHFEVLETDGMKVVDAFKKYVEANGIADVTFIHLPDPDKYGHQFAWMSLLYLWAVNYADQALDKIIKIASKASKEQATFIVMADHGGFGFSHMMDIHLNNHIPFIVNGPDIAAEIKVKKEIVTYDTAATILDLLQLPLPDYFDGKPVPLVKVNKNQW